MSKNEFILWVNSHQKQTTDAVHHHEKGNPLSVILVLNCRVQSSNKDLTPSAWVDEEVRRCIFAHTHELCHHQCSGSAAPAPCLLALIDQCFDQPWLRDLSSLLVFIYLLSTATPLVSSYTLDLRPNHAQLLVCALKKKSSNAALKEKSKKHASKVLPPCQTSPAVLSKVHRGQDVLYLIFHPPWLAPKDQPHGPLNTEHTAICKLYHCIRDECSQWQGCQSLHYNKS